MEEIIITENEIKAFQEYLILEEKSSATVEKYIRDARTFLSFAEQKPVTKELVMNYKNHLKDKKYAISSINSMLAALNSFLDFLQLADCKVKNIRTQRKVYCSEKEELTKEEYFRLLNAAKKKEKLYLILQTICGTGIRISELQYFTIESVKAGEITVSCKNKTRTILIPGQLRKRLINYADRNKIHSGAIFVTKNGNTINRSNIWSQMKKLSKIAGVDSEKVFPHNLRKLFARTFYGIEKDIAKLADILGHSSINTTRIYVMTTGIEERKKIERLGLVI